MVYFVVKHWNINRMGRNIIQLTTINNKLLDLEDDQQDEMRYFYRISSKQGWYASVEADTQNLYQI